MRGRKPVPTTLKMLRGNPGRRPLNADEPQPEDHDLHVPDWLDQEAQSEWHRMAPELLKLGLLSAIDGDALATYCQHWSHWKGAELQIQKHGMVIKGKGGYPVISPYVPIANRAMAQMKALLVEFGMTPSSRNRVTATKRKPAVDTQHDRFFGGGRG